MYVLFSQTSCTVAYADVCDMLCVRMCVCSLYVVCMCVCVHMWYGMCMCVCGMSCVGLEAAPPVCAVEKMG